MDDNVNRDDTLTGTTDADTFVFSPGNGTDVITDFTDGQDLIDLRKFAGITRFEDLTVTSSDQGVTIDLSAYGGGTILLQGFSIDDLDASDFVFSTLDGGGTTGDDVLQADDDGDRLEGGAGDDTLTGGAGADLLVGGEGNDTINGGAGHDSLQGGAGDDVIRGGTGADWIGGDEGADTIYGEAGNDSIEGASGDDRIEGGEGDDWLGGGEGADTLIGGVGDDEMFGDGGADTFVFEAGHGNDVVWDFTTGEDTIDLSGFADISGFGDLTLIDGDDGVTIDLADFGGGTILLKDISLADLGASNFEFSDGWVYGTDGVDSVQLSDEDDKYAGLGERDMIRGYGGDDILSGGAGADVLSGGEGDDTLIGGTGDDRLWGQQGADTLIGGAGDDELIGESTFELTGDDILIGGAGDDTMTGGVGSDTFVFAAGHGNDTINDFGRLDQIDLTAISDISGFEDLTITADGSAAVIDLTAHGGGTIRLQNTSLSDLDADDFSFFEPPADPGVEGI